MKKSLPKLLFAALLLLNSALLSGQELIGYEQKGSFSFLAYLLLIGNQAEYDVEAYKINYTTTDLTGAVDTASGLITFPKTMDISSPLTLIQHGTVPNRNAVPSNLQGGYELGAALSSIGYVTIQPDYLGLGDSDGLHPYVHAESEASAGIDMIFAAKAFLDEFQIAYNDQLFVTGYSQGGHAAMAAHRELEANYAGELPVTAAAPLSGPYSISTATKERLLSDEEYFFPGYAAWTLLSYNEAYGLYDSLTQYMKQPYAEYALAFKNEEIDLNTLHADMIAQLNQEFGASVVKNMFQDSIIAAIQADPDHPFNQALRDNDTYDWAPVAPTRMFYCMSDDQVSFTNSIIADSVMNANGAVDVESRDVAPSQDHGGCILPAGLATINFFNQYAQFTVSSNRRLVQLEGVSLYPNPAQRQVQLSGVPPDAQLQMLDMQGRTLRQHRLRADTESINVESLRPGVYLFRLTAPDGVWNQQVVVQ
ncbi:MAG TPA: T9SS type A sorting domain-containing protein [Saprospiraceae bacterium]|nr:T9SS type A sorting domain-containing protein [Saprospiraceae bacterium]